MTTENQIQVNLQKFKVKKQNLGAIEDAVNEVKQNLKNTGDMLTELVNNYNSDIDSLINEGVALAEKISTLMIEADMIYNQYEEEYLFIASELDAIGVPYDNIFPDVGSDYNDVKDLASSAYGSLTFG